jgi:hypothetical protein
MSLYIVHKRNPYFKPGTIIELFTDGFQEAITERVNHRLSVTGNKGLFYPQREVMPYCVRLLKRGFDKPGLRRKEPSSTAERAPYDH